VKSVRMTRILVGGHQDKLADVTASLHAEGVVHLEEFQDPTGTTSLGAPAEHGDEASDLLVRVRGLQRAISSEGMQGKQLVTSNAAQMVADAESEIHPILSHQSDLSGRLALLEAESSQLQQLSNLEIDLGAVRSVESVKVFLGTVNADPTRALQQADVTFDLNITQTKAGLTCLLMVPHDETPAADAILGDVGFNAITIAEVEGTPIEALARSTQRIAESRGEEASVTNAVAALRSSWGNRLAALELHLANEVETSMAPTKFAMTASTFHMEGWIPVNKANHLQNVLAYKYGDSLYMEELGDVPHDPHHSEAADEAPVSLKNGKVARPYEFILGLLGRPRYWEIDPTKLMSIFFPIFFGLMVGDILVGALIIAAGLLLRKNYVFGIGGPSVGKALIAGGIFSVIIGAFVFGEAMGLHFVIDDHAEELGEQSWETLLGLEFPEDGFLHKSVEHAPAVTEGAAVLAETTQDAAWYAPSGKAHLKAGDIPLGIYSKLHDIQALLIWSGLIGVFHLNLGIALGFRNIAKSHGVKLAIQERASWWFIQLGMVGVALGAMLGMGNLYTYGGAGLLVVGIALLWAGVQATLGAGFIALLEVPGFIGNLLSYTRLAAIGASKAGMALAFVNISFDMIGGGVAGWIMYSFAFAGITVLAILAGSLQSLRLQFVEFFGKFFTGGGREYTPFGRRP
jgi:V/A-type H+-transporting ATPase subunit I